MALSSLLKSSPHRRVALVTFNDEVKKQIEREREIKSAQYTNLLVKQCLVSYVSNRPLYTHDWCKGGAHKMLCRNVGCNLKKKHLSCSWTAHICQKERDILTILHQIGMGISLCDATCLLITKPIKLITLSSIIKIIKYNNIFVIPHLDYS